jgi:hypothetical protein
MRGDPGDAVTAAEDAVEAASSAKRRKVRKGAAVASELTSVLEVGPSLVLQMTTQQQQQHAMGYSLNPIHNHGQAT